MNLRYGKNQGIAQLHPVVQLQNKVCMLFGRVITWCCKQLSGYAQVQKQARPAFKLENQELSAPLHPGELLPGKVFDKLRCTGAGDDLFIQNFNFRDASADDLWCNDSLTVSISGNSGMTTFFSWQTF